jgi:hypothetical protein
MMVKSVAGHAVEIFNEFIENEFRVQVPEFDRDYALELTLEQWLQKSNEKQDFKFRNQTMSKMRALLEVFKNPSQEDIIMRLVGIKDISDQALKCLMSQNIEEYRPYQKLLTKLLNDEEFKDELATFEVSSIKVESQTKILKLIIRILNAKLFKSKGKQGKNMNAKSS